MTAVFRPKDRDAVVSSEAWDLNTAIRETSEWLTVSANAEAAKGSILDIGFDSRLSEKILVQGESIPIPFMRKLVELEITLWLSIYPPLEHGA